MKDILTILLTIIGLMSCNNRQADNTKTLHHLDSLSSISKIDIVDQIFNIPIRNIDSFNIQVGFSFFDSLNNIYSKDPQVLITTKTNLCGGDHCGSFKSMSNKKTGVTIHFCKGDNGEYGFTNDQFILKNDSLLVARSFDVTIKEWPTDSSTTIWGIEETIFYFNKADIKIFKRKETTEQLYGFDFLLKNKPADVQITYDKTLYKDNMDRLKTFLAAENVNDE